MSGDALHCRQRIEALQDLSKRAHAEHRSVGETLKGVVRIIADGFIAEILRRFLDPGEIIFDGLLVSATGPISTLITVCLRMASQIQKVSSILRELKSLADSISDRIADCEKEVSEATAELEMAREPLVFAEAAVGEVHALMRQADQAGTA
jgi:hypothetical protein